MGYFVKVKHNVKVYVEDLNPKGEKVIVFLHGWPGSHELFEYQFNKLPGLGYRCIGIDMRGFGKSDRPYTGYDYDTLSDDLKCVVDALKLNDFTLLGHSTGGGIAVRYMTRHKGHGIHDKVCHFALGEAQHRAIKNSKLVPFKFSGHGLFYDEMDKFNKELVNFIEE